MSFFDILGMDPLSFALTAYAAASVVLTLYAETLPGLDAHAEHYLYISELIALTRDEWNAMDRQRLICGGGRDVTSVELRELVGLERNIVRLSTALCRPVVCPRFYIIRQPLDVIQRLQAWTSPENMEIRHLISKANKLYYLKHIMPQLFTASLSEKSIVASSHIQFPIPQIAWENSDIEAGYSDDQLHVRRSCLGNAVHQLLDLVWQSEKNILAQCQIQFPIPVLCIRKGHRSRLFGGYF